MPAGPELKDDQAGDDENDELDGGIEQDGRQAGGDEGFGRDLEFHEYAGASVERAEGGVEGGDKHGPESRANDGEGWAGNAGVAHIDDVGLVEEDPEGCRHQGLSKNPHVAEIGLAVGGLEVALE